jgi:hypothetical protein
MIEEAEQQMNNMCDNVKQEQKAEYEKIIQKLRSEYEAEIAGLNEIIEKMQEVQGSSLLTFFFQTKIASSLFLF